MHRHNRPATEVDVSAHKQSSLKRPKMRKLADRDQYFNNLKRERQLQAAESVGSQESSSSPKTFKRKPGPIGTWENFEPSEGFCSIDKIARPLVEHGWTPDEAVSFARRAITARYQHRDTRFCPCGAKATVASEKSGPRCVTCLLELDCSVIVLEEPEPARFGQRRAGIQLGDPSPWRENAVRSREGD